MSNQALIERPLSPATAVDSPTSSRVRWTDGQILLGLVIFVLAANGPLLYLHFRSLISRSYYDFIYVLPIAIWLMYRRYGGIANEPILQPKISRVIPAVLFSAFVCAASVVLWSPWLAAIGVLLTLPTLIYMNWGAARLLKVIPAWLLGWLAIPPPLIYDRALTSSLRSAATLCSSRFLDSLGVLHLAEGNVITVSKGSLFIADACSGVNSLYSLLALTLFYCLWVRRHYVHTCLLIALVLPVVLLENALRIGVIPVAREWFDVDLSHGWQHTFLGIVLFVLSGLLIASFDQLLQFVAPLGSTVLSVFSRRAKSTQYAGYVPHVSRRQPALQGSGWGRMILILLVAIAIGGVTQAVGFAHWLDSQPSWRVRTIDVSMIKAESLPAEWNGWKQIGFETIKRAEDDPFGKSSLSWTYGQGGRIVRFSIDYPFPDLHDLSKCYGAIGWTESDRESAKDRFDVPYASLKLQRPLHTDALLFFSLHNLQGRSEVYFPDKRPIVDRFVGREDAGPWYQFQLFSTAFQNDSEVEKGQLIEMFTQFRQQLIDEVGK